MSLRQAHLRYRIVETAPSPLGEIMLRRYDTDEGESGYEIRLNGNFLMATHGNHSEKAMAALARGMLKDAEENLAVLVGGLGAGYTLRAALDLEGVGHVVVAEISGKVVEWNRVYFSETNGHAIDDSRTHVVIGDLADHLASADAAYHLALLDVDNGPGWVAANENARLYTPAGLELCRRALKPGGVLAVWSPSANPVFHERFKAVFTESAAVDTTSLGKAVGEPGDVIYLGKRAAE